MDEPAVFHSVTQNAVIKSIPFFDKAFIRERVYTETAQRHHDLIGAFDVFRAPTFEIARVKLQFGKSAERFVYHVVNVLCHGLFNRFLLVCICLFGIVIRCQSLQCHGGQVGVGSSAAQRKAAVRQLAGQNLGYYIVAGVISVSGNGVTL